MDVCLNGILNSVHLIVIYKKIEHLLYYSIADMSVIYWSVFVKRLSACISVNISSTKLLAHVEALFTLGIFGEMLFQIFKLMATQKTVGKSNIKATLNTI